MDHESTSAPVDLGGLQRRSHRVRRPFSARPAIVIVHWISLAIALVILLDVNRRSWFFADEIDFLNRLVQPQTANIWFLPHNEHWSTVPLAAYWVIFRFVGMRTYWPYLSVLLVVHLLLVHVIWRLMIRTRIPATVATGIAAILAVLGAGAENLTWAFQIGFILSLLLGVLAVMVADHRTTWSLARLFSIWGLSILSLASSGLGIPMLFCASVVALGRRGFRSMLTTLSIPVFVYGIWYELIGYKGTTNADSVGLSKLLQLPSYAWTGLTHALETTTGITGAGAALLLAIGAYVIYRSPLALGDALPAFAMAATALFSLLFIGLARTELGTEEATASRYVYVSMMLLAPIVGLAIGEIYRRSVVATICVVVAAILVAGNNLQLLRVFPAPGHTHYELGAPFKANTLGAAHLISMRAELVGDAIPLLGNPETLLNAAAVSISSLKAWVKQGALPSNAASQAGILGAGTYLQVLIGPRSVIPSRTAATHLLTAAGAILQGDCLRVPAGGSPLLQVSRPTSMGIDGLNASTTFLWLRLNNGFSGPRLKLSSTSASAFLNVSRVGQLRLYNAAGGDIQVCNVAPRS